LTLSIENGGQTAADGDMVRPTIIDRL